METIFALSTAILSQKLVILVFLEVGTFSAKIAQKAEEESRNKAEAESF